jgi:hypothetical protein
MAKIEMQDHSELVPEIEALDIGLVGKLAGLLSGSSNEAVASTLAATVSYFQETGVLDMEKFRGLLLVCEAASDLTRQCGAHKGPIPQA